MDPDRWRRIEEIYQSAAERKPEEREAFFAAACDGDEELRREVVSLLAQQSVDTPLDHPAMDLAAGSRLGPYELLEPIGHGGMGAVFKARDTRLNRNVAIKVSTAQFSGRFANEARSVAALNHPNICTLHDVGPNYLVMELVEGADVAGPVPVETAISYARQIAAGLEAAHEKGIIHRDLKPANIKVTPDGTIKILDFGLAKASVPAASAPALTESGMILGTAAYMSPEQARGERVDKRADIWAFGVVFYELLTGKPLFGDGKSVSDAIAAVLTREPDFTALPKGTPPRVRRLLEHCLRKDPKRRLHDIGDAYILLDELEPEAPGPPAPPTPPAPPRRWPWVAVLATFAILAAIALYRWLDLRPSEPFQRIQITRLTDSGKASAAAISPDGKYVVHAVTDEGKSSLWLLNVATGSNIQILPTTPGAYYRLSFSRDGNSLYYALDTGKPPYTMYTMPILGGTAKTLAVLPSAATASFSPDEKHLAFTRGAGGHAGLFVSNLDGKGERRLAERKAPEMLLGTAWSPDGKTIAFSIHSRQGGLSAGLATIPVEGGIETRLSPRIGYNIQALGWLPGGHGLVATANAQYPFLQVWYVSHPEGEPRRITNDLNSYRGLSLTADGGALVTVQNEVTSHLWVVAPDGRENARQISTGRLDGLGYMAWAGNGNLYFEAPDSSGDTQIWLTTADGTGRRQVTTDPGLTGMPAFCGDDRYLLFCSYREGTPHIWRSDLDGGNVRQLTSGESEFSPSCSPDGGWLAYYSTAPENRGVWRMPIDGGAPIRIWDQPSRPEFSPDGKSVLVREFVAEPKVRIIPAGGGQPSRSFDAVSELGGSRIVLWSADGTALLYVKTVGGVSNIWQRPINGGEPKQVTRFTSLRITAFALSRDGKRLALARGSSTSDVVLIKDLK